MQTLREENTLFYTIHLPVEYKNIRKRLPEIQRENQNLEILLHNSSTIRVVLSQSLEEDGYFGIKLPGWQESYFEPLRELNPEINFEYANTEEVYIKMGIFAMIGLFTTALVSSLYIWARKNKTGNVYSDPTEYELEVKPGDKKQKRIPDLSFISYAKVPKDVQKKWRARIPVSPNLVVEIVSAKRGLEKDLKKMATVWMPAGAELGLVLCPYSEKIYIFEKDKSEYRTQSIYSQFTHPTLPAYSENFGELWQECR
ncbi:MAG: Uma2 family endonuclease [Spirochaetota bacterium]